MAGVMMGFMTVALWPIVTPPETLFAAYMFGVPFCVVFLRDWLVVSGQLNPHSERFIQLSAWVYKAARRWLPLVARIVAVYLLVSGEVSVVWGSFVGVMTVLGGVMVGGGIIGRLGALILLIPSVFAPAPLAPRFVLLACACWLTLFGNGGFSLWLPEELLFEKRLG